jgi:hypothetical protein
MRLTPPDEEVMAASAGRSPIALIPATGLHRQPSACGIHGHVFEEFILRGDGIAAPQPARMAPWHRLVPHEFKAIQTSEKVHDPGSTWSVFSKDLINPNISTDA